MRQSRFFWIITSGTLCIILVSLLIILTGCNILSPSGKTVVKYWTGWTGAEMAIQKKIIQRFNATHPKIEVQINTVASSYEKVKIAFASGSPPDVCSAIWADELASYAMRGALTPLDDYYQKSNRHGDEYMPGCWDMFHYGGKLWALNVTTNAMFFVYNKKMYREAGLDANAYPRTIAEFDAVNDKLAKFDDAGNIKQFGHRPSNVMFWAYVFGGKWYDPKTKTVLANIPGNVKALEWLASYNKKYNCRKIDAFNQVFASGTYGDQYAGLFGLFTNRVGMLITGEYSLEHIQRYTDKNFEYGYYPAPNPPGGREKCLIVGGSVFVIPKDSKNKDAAWEFLNYMTQPDQVREFCYGIKNLPPLRSVAQEKLFTEIPMFQFAGDLVAGQNAFGPPQMPTWQYYLNEIQRVEERAVFGKENPKKLLDELNDKIQKDLDNSLRDAAYM
jgi:multiple sugar transport system substrate-binding protein